MPIKQVGRWQTDDGRLFNTEELAKVHEKRCDLRGVIETIFENNAYFDDDDTCYIDLADGEWLTNFLFIHGNLLKEYL